MEKKIFPHMYSKPENNRIFAIIACWLFIFVLIPWFLPILGLGLWEEYEISVWLEIGYHALNGIIALLLIGSYLKDEWFMVSIEISHYLKHIALTVGLIAVAESLLLGALYFCGFNIGYMLEFLPVTAMSICQTPLFVIHNEPVFGTLALSVFAPISICVFFYCVGFAPICTKKPWLAYLSIAVVTLIPAIFDIIWRGEAALVLGSYFAHLPIHLLLCWSYQKTNNVWSPMVSLVVTNLLISLLLQFLLLQ